MMRGGLTGEVEQRHCCTERCLSVTASGEHRITILKDIYAAYHQRDVLGWKSGSNQTLVLMAAL